MFCHVRAHTLETINITEPNNYSQPSKSPKAFPEYFNCKVVIQFYGQFYGELKLSGLRNKMVQSRKNDSTSSKINEWKIQFLLLFC